MNNECLRGFCGRFGFSRWVSLHVGWYVWTYKIILIDNYFMIYLVLFINYFTAFIKGLIMTVLDVEAKRMLLCSAALNCAQRCSSALSCAHVRSAALNCAQLRSVALNTENLLNVDGNLTLSTPWLIWWLNIFKFLNDQFFDF